MLQGGVDAAFATLLLHVVKCTVVDVVFDAACFEDFVEVVLVITAGLVAEPGPIRSDCRWRESRKVEIFIPDRCERLDGHQPVHLRCQCSLR